MLRNCILAVYQKIILKKAKVERSIMVRVDRLIGYVFGIGAIIGTLWLAIGFWGSYKSHQSTAISLDSTKHLTIGELKHLQIPNGKSVYVKIEGTMSCMKPEKSILSSVPSCWSKVTLESMWKAVQTNTWRPCYGQDIVHKEVMQLSDGTGTVEVDATGANVLYTDMVYDQVIQGRPKLFPDAPASITGQYRMREFVIKPGSHVVVTGPVVRKSPSSSDIAIRLLSQNQSVSAQEPYIIAIGTETETKNKSKGAEHMELRMLLIFIVVFIGVPIYSRLVKSMRERNRRL